MFANLKNKLIEEVKASPSKFQQFANAAQAAVSTSSSTLSGSESVSGNENFFSITEEDTPQNSPYKPLKLPSGAGGRTRTPNISPQSLNNGGAVPRARKLSNSSVASDVSFRMPTYDSPAVYHLQSDLDASASEVEDSAPPAKLDVINKEQLYDAYKKALDRYYKYRSRYTDLAKKYKDLEHDSTKARSVLVETQEKAIRRISELREQCTLEQQAKAHLEEALRIEMDDMQCKMQAYQTKLKLLGENPDNIAENNSFNDTKTDCLIDMSSGSTTGEVNNLINLSSENANHINKSNPATATDVISQLEELLSERDKEIEQLNRRLQSAMTSIESLEKQNTIQLAQTKLAIHTELEDKESEVRQLKAALSKIEHEYQTANADRNKVTRQVSAELAELKEKLQQTVSAKQESDAKLIASDHLLGEKKQQLTDKEKELLALNEKVRTLEKEHEHKVHDLRQQNDELNEMIHRYQKAEISLAEIDNELNQTKTENDSLKNIVTTTQQKLQQLQNQLDENQCHSKQNSKDHTTIEQELNDAKVKTEELTKKCDEYANLQLSRENLISQLELDKKTLSEQNKMTTTKLTKLKRQHDVLQMKSKEQAEEMQRLSQTLTEHEKNLVAIQTEHQNQDKKNEHEKAVLKSQITNILQEISQMEEQMRVVQKSHADLEQEKRNLESKIENMTKVTQDASEGTKHWREQLNEAGEKLKQFERENFQLAEKNCLLEENSNRLEKLITECEKQQSQQDTETSKIKYQIKTAEGTILKLNEKMSQILDENSLLHNAKELMEHEFRSLQDKCEVIEKEKLCVVDSNNEIEQEHTALKIELDNLKKENLSLSQMFDKNRAVLDEFSEKARIEQDKNIQLTSELTATSVLKQSLENEVESLRVELRELKTLHDEQIDARSEESEVKLKMLNEELKRVKENELSLNSKLATCKESLETKIATIEELNEKLNSTQTIREDLNRCKEELNLLKETETSLRLELEQSRATCKNGQQKAEEMNEKLNAASISAEELSRAKEQCVLMQKVEKDLRSELNENTTQSLAQLDALKMQLKAAQEDVEKLNESNIALQVEIDVNKSKYETRLAELNEILRRTQNENEENTRLSVEIKQKLADKELRIENEYLNTQTKQLETIVLKQKEEIHSKEKEIAQVKDKIQSNQCEMYVLKQKEDKHSAEIQEKYEELKAVHTEIQTLTSALSSEREELIRQVEHAKFITTQNDTIQRELLHYQQQLTETQKHCEDVQLALSLAKEEKTNLSQSLAAKEALSNDQLDNLQKKLKQSDITIETLKKEVDEITTELSKRDHLQSEIEALKDQLTHRQPSCIETATETIKSTQQESENLRKINKQLQRKLEDLKYKSMEEISNLTQESSHLTDKITEYKKLGNQRPYDSSSKVHQELIQREKEELETQLKTIMQDVQGVSNRNLFLEQQCENFLIIEQSNERLKLQNEKLSRQLDETLVSMQHNEGIAANTEFEYLKNIMFQYLTGTASDSSETLVKVISAVLKFSPQQTQVAIEKEHQRRSLINKLL